MREATCEGCSRTLPMNDTFLVVGRVLCEDCGNQWLSGRAEPPPTGSIVAQVDPTVCRNCQADGGNRELPLVAGQPVCDTCEGKFRGRPFPRWVKASFAALLVIAVVSFVYNWRFFRAHIERRQAERALRQGDVARAAALMKSAAERVPERKELKDEAVLLEGLQLLAEDRSAEAVPLLKAAATRLPPGRGRGQEVVAQWLLAAEAGAAFDAKDYDLFLEKQKQLLKLLPNEPMALAGVASAHACKYAASGDESHKREAERYLEMANQHARDAAAAEYRQRILHRLATREIIHKTEFDRRFPGGWKPEAAQ